MQAKSQTTLYLGEVWQVLECPLEASKPKDCLQVLPKGALAVDAKGEILACGDAADLRKRYGDAKAVDFGDALILPGFIDSHIHLPQMDMIGSYGKDLLGWLNEYTFPAEAQFSQTSLAQDTGKRFFQEVLKNGVTTAAVFGTTHESATDIFFQEAQNAGLRAIIGKTSMDRFGPDAILQNAADDTAANHRLIQKWHEKDGRLFYALTPRFAPTCSEELLKSLAELKAKYKSLYVQTHHAETKDEVAWVKRLFPKHDNYLNVYDAFDLLGQRTLLGHSIYVSDAELKRIEESGSSIIHCPTSNLFLGSGLFPFDHHKSAHSRLALGTDVGGGTSFSLWTTMAEAYKIQKIRVPSQTISPVELFYMATLGGAKALSLGNVTGNFAAKKSADFQVLNWRKSSLLEKRLETVDDPQQRLFAAMHLADDRLVERVFLKGKEIYCQTNR